MGLKINIGAGGTRMDGYITLDYDKNENPDYVVDLEKDVLPFSDNSVEVVIAHHVLEHLGEGYFHCLKELYRVCCQGAVIDVRVPHFRHDFFHDDPTHRRPITPGGLQLFSKKYNQICREQHSASSRLGDYFNVDFEIHSIRQVLSRRYAEHVKGMAQSDLERLIAEHSNVVEEFHIQLKVVK